MTPVFFRSAAPPARSALTRISKTKGKKLNVTYVFDTTRGIKLFADQASYAVAGGDIAPFLLKKDAEAHAAKSKGKVLGFEEAVKSAVGGRKT